MVPVWRGAQLGSRLCTKCHNRMLKELSDTSMPLITEGDQDFRLRQVLQGPCAFGCKSSALDNCFKGRMQWHRAPDPCPWPGVQAGAVLCNACYNGFRYHSSRPGRTLPRQQWSTKRAITDISSPPLAIDQGLTHSPFVATGDIQGDPSLQQANAQPAKIPRREDPQVPVQSDLNATRTSVDSFSQAQSSGPRDGGSGGSSPVDHPIFS